ENVEILRFNELSNLDMDQEIGNENKKDGQILSQLLLKDYECDLLKRIFVALKPFKLATKFFLGSKYPTLSLMYPTIRELQNQYMHSDEISNSEDDEDNDQSDILLDSENENEDEFYSQLDSVCDARSHALSLPPNLDLIEKEFKNAIFNSLEKNWYDFHEIGLVATLLDPRTKKISLFTSKEQTLPTAPEITQNLFFEGIFGVQDHKDIAPLDEVIQYLDLAP
ncbi:12400_t:CDS:2, partial [Gigaspora rosea]